MRNIAALLLLTLLALAVPVQAGEGIWTPAGPPGTYRLTDFSDQLVVDPFTPGTLYTVYFGEGSSGAWRSVDGGASWTSINAGLGTSYVFSLVADPFAPGTLYALADLTKVFKSVDHGETWTQVYDAQASGGTALDRLIADPTTSGALWGTYQGFIFRSADGGATWSPVTQLSESGFVTGLFPDPRTPDTVYVTTSAGLWKSVDRGAHWTNLGGFNNQGFDWIEIAPSRPATVYAHTTVPLYLHPGCLRSDNGGATWTSISFPDAGELCTAIVVDPQDPLKIWALAPDTRRFFASTDGGETWAEVHEGLPENLALFLLRRDVRTGVFYTLGPTGVFRGADGGATWQLGNRGLARVVLSTFLPLQGPRTILLASVGLTGTQPQTPFLRSRNRGRFWNPLSLTEVTALEVDPKDPAHVLAAAGLLPKSANLHESRDAGVTWKLLGKIPDVGADIAFHPLDPRRVLIGTRNSGVFQSRDGGRTWQASSGGIPFPPDCDHISCQFDTNPTYDISFDPRNPDQVLAVFDRRLILRSENGGWRWSKVPGEPVRVAGTVALVRDPRRGGGVVYAAALDNLFKSFDGGVTWRRLGGNFRPAGSTFRDLAFDPRNGGVLYAATGVGVFRSLDDGNTWEAINEGLGILDVLRLEIDPNIPGGLFASTDGAGIWSWEP
jgi:photosystem II stability/assembly factor-like uncharacterized protein